MANTSVGLDAATTGTPLSMAMTITLWCRAVVSGITPATDEIDTDGVEVDELEAHLLGHAPHEVGLGDQLLVGQDAGDALAGEVVLLEGEAHRLERDTTAVDQGLGQGREPGQVSRSDRLVALRMESGRWRPPRPRGRRRPRSSRRTRTRPRRRERASSSRALARAASSSAPPPAPSSRSPDSTPPAGGTGGLFRRRPGDPPSGPMVEGRPWPLRRSLVEGVDGSCGVGRAGEG